MGSATSIVIIAVGAVLRYAVSAQTDGVNLHTVGMIFMIVGTLGLIVSIAFWNSWGGFHRRQTIVDAPRTVIRDEY